MVTPEGEEESRLQLYGEILPDLPPRERLHDIWQRLGYAMPGFNGPVPFTFGEMQAFASLSHCNLAPVEALCLVDMSRAYCAEIMERSPLRKAPMEREQ
jgi:hypothetical protein